MCLAIPMKIEDIKSNKATVVSSGIRKIADITMVPDVKQGDYILMHAGFAIQKISKEDAKKTLKVWEELKKI